MQDFGCVSPFLGNAIRVVVQLGAVARHDLAQFCLPFRSRYLVLEDFLKHAQHDRRCSRSTWRCAQQTGDGAVLGSNDFGTQLQNAAFFFVTLDDLYALTGLHQAPVFFLGVREVLLQSSEAIVVRHHYLTCQVFDQRVLFDTNASHRPHVMRGGAGQQIEVGTVFQELGREGRERAEQDHALAIQNTGVKVRNRHGWRASRRDTVGFAHMLHGQSLVVGDKPRTADREAAVFLGFRNTGFLQKVQGSTASADEQELGVGLGDSTVFQVLVLDAPGAVVVVIDVFDFARQLQIEILLGFQIGDELAGDLAEVDVGANRAPGHGQLLRRVTTFHHQWNPLLDLLVVFGVLHAAEQRAGLQCCVTLAQELDVVVAPHEAHVRRGVDERTRVLQNAGLDLPRPELTGNLERFVDLDGLGDINVAVLVFRGVVQLGQGRVAGTGVVPAVGAFFGHAIETLDHFHRPARLQLVEPDRKCCTHDSAADEQYVDFLGFSRLHGHQAHGNGQTQQGRVHFFKHSVIHLINAIRRLILKKRPVTCIEACDKRSHPQGLEVDIQGQYNTARDLNLCPAALTSYHHWIQRHE
ncbi:hypothetical protein ALO82_102019 [Pseudomonas syringae pv. broussonetiae]|nr:hypothetical protein ALO82_102019 [Pseudomonas syringae pv. broussonetiae]